jgi:hypothetical protein
MLRTPAVLTMLLSLLAAGCGGGSSSASAPSMSMPSSSSSSSSSATARGAVISNAELAVYAPSDLLNLIGQSTLGKELETLSIGPLCNVNVYQVDFYTVGGKGETATSSAALMIPSGSSSAACSGSRPVVMYAHGTNPSKSYNLGVLANSAEGVLVAAVFASQGYIVIAPNYAGYVDSSLSYHPYLVAAQQAGEMIDALTAAKSVLPEPDVPNLTNTSRLFITGYSQGGHVAMATHRAMQSAGIPVTASGPMSGPYALAAFADAVFAGQVNLSATENFALIANAYQNTYGNLSPSEIFAAPYASDVIGLLPSTLPITTIYANNQLPQALFSSMPPAPQYASITPATTPAVLASAFAQGFGNPFLVTNGYRLSYLQDAQANPDGGFPTLTTGVPAASPTDPLRQDAKTNDLRNWSPGAPVLLCGADQDPDVFFFNLQLMQTYWTAHPGTATPTYVDLETTGAPFAVEKAGFAAAKTVFLVQGGQTEVLANYHATLVPPFCLAIVKSFFDAAP